MSAHQMEALRNMESHLDLVAEAMRSPPSSEDQKTLVHDMLRECKEHRKQLEDLGMVVIEQDGGEATFNQVAGELDRLDHLQETYQSWVNSPPAQGSPPASAPPAVGVNSTSSRLSPGSIDEHRGLGAPVASPSQSNLGSSECALDMDSRRSDTGRKEKKKKDKKEKRRETSAEDFGFPTPNAAGGSADLGGDAFGVGLSDSIPGMSSGAQGFGSSWPTDPPEESAIPPASSGWGAPTSDAAAWGTSGASGVDAWGSQCHLGQRPDDGADRVSFDVASWGHHEPSRGAEGPSGAIGAPSSGFGAFGEPATLSPGTLESPYKASQADMHEPSWRTPHQADSYRGGSLSRGTCATLHIRHPYATIKEDVEGFTEQFVRAAAQAAGVAPHRIHVRAVRPAT